MFVPLVTVWSTGKGSPAVPQLSALQCLLLKWKCNVNVAHTKVLYSFSQTLCLNERDADARSAPNRGTALASGCRGE